MSTAIFMVGLLALLLVPTLSDAGCRWDWDCTRTPCRQIQVCDSTIDLPAIRPPEIAPIPAPSIPPIPSPSIPPIGTSQCRQVNLCNQWGQCRWETVCH
jgi:hypothetical protein